MNLPPTPLVDPHNLGVDPPGPPPATAPGTRAVPGPIRWYTIRWYTIRSRSVKK